ncbi:hypothetical protein EVAR_41585_1 [Eumeta japonica]|uniref:Reverse transcriptase domain-containing protein n=1 Tax=Eumeta variegata TaxID=151549 RepID=A0A4C1Y4L0_EUMVA|nr:hypothetical protein EVAR_41585_1 [Eumeta japonica]
MDELSVKHLLYAEDQLILASAACGLQEMVNKMNDSVKKRGMKVNVDKTKLLTYYATKTERHLNYRTNAAQLAAASYSTLRHISTDHSGIVCNTCAVAGPSHVVAASCAHSVALQCREENVP